MPSKNPAQHLAEIITNIDAIREFTAGMDLASFKADRRTVYAVVRALEIISEASRRLPPEMIERHPEIGWPAVAAAGNIYRHEYEAVEDAMVWSTVCNDLAPLRESAVAELARMSPPPGAA
ncbi:MAG: DUF86 domain-containing protein [Bryobacterales bacterium]|nr:DUF86 domain-containing protein [Bryobacterales bacterium]